ncbi:MAG: DUF2155 domain-containing protein [Caulobacteraceae bacterium]
MDPRLRVARWALVPLAAVIAVGAFELAKAQVGSPPNAAENGAPGSNSAFAPPAPSSAVVPPPQAEVAPQPNVAPLNSEIPFLSDNEAVNAAPNAQATSQEAKKSPPPPPLVVRSPVAIIQALDKVTAETMRFAVPVGTKVRYKTLVFDVRACETRDVDQAFPRPSAYLVITSAPQYAPGGAVAPPKEVFHGWIFGQSPGLDPLQNPIYDAWLVACSASLPNA